MSIARRRPKFKAIYEVNPQDMEYPDECYQSRASKLLGITSPSRMFFAAAGGYGDQVANRCVKAEISQIKHRINLRTASRSDMARLRRYERSVEGGAKP